MKPVTMFEFLDEISGRIAHMEELNLANGATRARDMVIYELSFFRSMFVRIDVLPTNKK